MRHLLHITDETLHIDGVSMACNINKREAARAVVFNKDGKVALLYSGKDGYHKLPGGGIEEGERWQDAVAREAMEEIGCSVKLRNGGEIGIINEVRKKFGLEQTSYCAIADVISDDAESVQMTEEEQSIGLEPAGWFSMDEAINLVKNDSPREYTGLFIQKRDLAFLEEAKRVIASGL